MFRMTNPDVPRGALEDSKLSNTEITTSNFVAKSKSRLFPTHEHLRCVVERISQAGAPDYYIWVCLLGPRAVCPSVERKDFGAAQGSPCAVRPRLFRFFWPVARATPTRYRERRAGQSGICGLVASADGSVGVGSNG